VYYREKFPNFVAWAEPDLIKQYFSRFRVGLPSTILRTAYRKQFCPMVLMESRDSEGVPFASLERL